MALEDKSGVCVICNDPECDENACIDITQEEIDGCDVNAVTDHPEAVTIAHRLTGHWMPIPKPPLVER